MADLITKIASDEVIDAAYAWLCKRREKWSPQNDVWDLRWRWQTAKPAIQAALLAGEYVFQPLYEVRLPQEIREYWGTQDALVLKAVALVLGEHLKPFISANCVHVTGHGGAKKAVGDTFDHLAPNSWVMKSDVRSYYASIDHMILFDMLTAQVHDRFVLRLLCQYMKRTVCFGGLYRAVERGIPLGCALSPLMGALYLEPLDSLIKKTGLYYSRFMDDWIVIAPTRWALRKVVKMVNRVLNLLKVEKAPDKTFIGRIENGFDFLGYHFSPDGLSVAEKTIEKFLARVVRLYEQEQEEPFGSPLLGLYVRRWVGWLYGGVAL